MSLSEVRFNEPPMCAILFHMCYIGEAVDV